MNENYKYKMEINIVDEKVNECYKWRGVEEQK